MRYAHTNIIARDCEKLISFYKEVFNCKSIGEKRNLSGEWLDKLTGIRNSRITGEHLRLPGYAENYPTLEIFSYGEMNTDRVNLINSCGIAHIAFEVEDVAKTLKKVLDNGGGTIGETVHAHFKDGRKATFVYATDIEGNILELQSWK
jgi:glyoxylase I family protein